MGRFGDDRRLEATLREWGRPATADVSDAHRTHRLHSSGGAVDGQSPTASWDLCLQVRPADEPPFDAKLTEAVPLGEEISVGQSVEVLYDPHDHTRVAIDHGAQRGMANREEGQCTEAAVPRGAPGPGPTPLNLMPDTASDRTAPLFRQGMLAHPSAGRPKLTDVSKDPGGTTEDQLAKLADLLDRGAMTAAEFEQQKKKLGG